jgi:hypothetical protein
MNADEARAAYIDGLRKLADALERSQAIPLPDTGSKPGSELGFFVHGRKSEMTGTRLAAMVRALGGEGWQQRTKPGSGITWLEITGQLAGLFIEINADADQVCEPIDPQPVIERSCPALDAVIAEAQEGGTS